MSVIKRGNSKFWYVQFQFNGKTIVKTAKTTNKQKALLYEKKLREEVMSEELLGEKRLITVSDSLDQYELSKRSLASHECILANICFVLGIMARGSMQGRVLLRRLKELV